MVSTGVQHLCKELGPTEVIGEDGQPIPQSGASGGILSEVKQLLMENKGGSDHIAALQASVHGLMSAVHESMQTAEARGQFREWIT